MKINSNQKILQRIVADDYGMSQTVNNAILNQLKKKSITHVSVFANIVSKKELNVLKKYTKDSQIVAHINLLRGKPISKTNNVPSLVNKNGEFFTLPQFLFKLIFRKISKKEIANEIKLQIQFFYKNRINLNEVNSEQHLQAFEPIRSIINKVAKEEKITKVRNLKSIENYLKKRPFKYLVYYTFSRILKFIYKPTLEEISKDIDVIVHPGSNYD